MLRKSPEKLPAEEDTRCTPAIIGIGSDRCVEDTGLGPSIEYFLLS